MTDAPLTGFRIAVTSDRRSADLLDAFERRGASVLHAPFLKIAPKDEDEELIEETRNIIAFAPEILIVTTAYGFRRWIETADAAGLGEALEDTLRATNIYVRGPKARGAVRALGFDDCGVSPDERLITLADQLATAGLTGQKVVVQLHGHDDLTALARLRMAGATLMTVTPYRWAQADDNTERREQLLTALLNGTIDVLTFTAAPVVDAFFSYAAEQSCTSHVLRQLTTVTKVAAVGPVTATPLIAAGVDPLVPERFRMGAMIRQIVEFLREQADTPIRTTQGDLYLQGTRITLDGVNVELTDSQRVVLRALAAQPGTVVTRAQLAALLGIGQGDHALDVAISRLRSALPDSRLVSTVIKRGYRLSV
ncbi:uroporphyrinogen-III synthase [Jonesia quinghaiensis]|uniref:uroporphyrinogen-III synthase n=1 Tax=Jonesia quinghaiensis TaxID=262806 RepID=UPI000426EEBD|nr:uroporphyrinogen-III synthase [Jonesia quinghaiensis]